jgi:serine/threonine protein kinase
LADLGTTLGGRYRLIELLGQGGMATIYRARDNQLERDVAVKVLRPEYGNDPDFFARFRQEAQSAASLNHPGVVAVLRSEDLDGNVPLELGVVGTVDRRHAALAEQLDQPVAATEDLPDLCQASLPLRGCAAPAPRLGRHRTPRRRGHPPA